LHLPLFSAFRLPTLWAQDCALCLADSHERLVCRACERDLEGESQGCERCASPLTGDGRCLACRGRRFAFDAALARFDYRYPVDRLVRRFKYAGDLAVGSWLAQRLAERAEPMPRPDVLVAPPLATARLRERGFNQAIEIARVVGRRLRVPVDAHAIERRRDTPPQARLDRRARQANLRGVFECVRDLKGSHVAIVDDVLTTGATADALARVLKEAGAARVSAWAVARAPEPDAR
jgi:ComF family protein